MKESLLEKLQKFGLNLYEAKAYVALLKIGTANAYKISKESNIPRARIYDVLESLLKLGLVMVEETSDNAKTYSPVPSKVFLERIKDEWENDFEDISVDLQSLETEEKQEIYVFTVKSKENITAYCRQLLREAKKYVLVSMWNQMYELFLPDFEACQKRGCKILGIGHNIQDPIAGIETHNHGKNHNMPENLHWFIISADGKKLIYGYSVETNKDAFYTEDTSHIYLMEDYIMHDMIINRTILDKELEKRLNAMMKEIVDILKE